MIQCCPWHMQANCNCNIVSLFYLELLMHQQVSVCEQNFCFSYHQNQQLKNNGLLSTYVFVCFLCSCVLFWRNHSWTKNSSSPKNPSYQERIKYECFDPPLISRMRWLITCPERRHDILEAITGMMFGELGVGRNSRTAAWVLTFLISNKPYL